MLAGLFLGALFVTPFVIAYALFVKWCDRFEPEPWWLLISAFLFGALFATLGGGISSAIAQSVTATYAGLSPADGGLEAMGATVFAPVFEEGFKGIGVAIIAAASALGLRELDGPLDGAIYGGIIGLGFTLTEDILYVANMFAHAGFAGFVALLFLRTVLLGLSHCTFTACTGIGFGLAVHTKSPALKIFGPVVGFACAVTMHAFHNAMPTFFGGAGTVLMILASWIIDILFFVLLAILVVRDRAIVITELTSEVGHLLHPQELKLITTYVTIGWRNMGILFSRGWKPFALRRRKQLALVELAFLKSRRRRGETGNDMDAKEAKLRHEIAVANHMGVWLGA